MDKTPVSDSVFRIRQRKSQNDICNCWYIQSRPVNILIDAGLGEYNFFEAKLIEKPCILLLTHWHADHIGGANMRAFERVYLSRSEKDYERDPDGVISPSPEEDDYHYVKFGFRIPHIENLSFYDEGGQVFDEGRLVVIPTPGHSVGSVCFLYKNSILFTGDTLYQNTPVLEFPSSDTKEYENSLEKLNSLIETIPTLTLVCGGHYGTMNRKQALTRIQKNLKALTKPPSKRLKCRICFRTAGFMCAGENCYTPYCGAECAKQDWIVEEHYRLCLIEGKKREREEEEETEYWQCEGHPEWSFKRDVIGEGTYGYVMVACISNLDDCSYVAKVFKHPEDPESFHKEVRIMGLLSGSGIAPEVYDYFECPGKGNIIIMERLDGTLTNFPVARVNKNSPAFYMAVFGQLAKLLAQLHRDYQIAHRDLFYRNVMYRWPDRFYLIDFGLAKEHAEEEDFIRDIELLAKMASYKLSEKEITRLFRVYFPNHMPFTRGDLARSAPASFYSKSL